MHFSNLLQVTFAALFFLPSSPAATVTFDSSAIKLHCPTALNTPTKLAELPGGDKFKVLIDPTANEGELCTLTRVNHAGSSVYIPIARSFDGTDWQRSEGKYVSCVSVSKCGEASSSGTGYVSGDYLCEIELPELSQDNDGYYITSFESGIVSNKTKAARFLEKATFGPKLDDITALESELQTHGTKALATWVQNQLSAPITSHRKFFRERLNPRTTESYQYGVPGPRACEEGARFRRFSFTYKDMELSRGSSGDNAGNDGLPFTPVEIETMTIGGTDYYALKFNGHIRTILNSPLQYEDNGLLVTLPDGAYTICHLDEVVGDLIGNESFDYQFQLVVGELCTSSYTDRDGVADGKGDGATDEENIRVGGTLFRIFDMSSCNAKTSGNCKRIIGGNPEVSLPDAFDTSKVSWVDLSNLDASSEILNVNSEQTHDSNWLLQKDMSSPSCVDENGNEIPNPAGLSYNDLRSFGRGRFNTDKPVFAKLPSNKWAIHDMRTVFEANTMERPLPDGGGKKMKLAARTFDANYPNQLVVRCSNVPRNIFNEGYCKVSYDSDACVSNPLYYGNDPISHYLPRFAGPDNGGVVICGSENEVAPIATEDDGYDVTNRKVQSHRIDYNAQKGDIWMEIAVGADDQLCQRMAFALSKIFATSTTENADTQNTETNIVVYDNFVSGCFSTYKDITKRVSFNEEMSTQLTYQSNKAVHTYWHRSNSLSWPDENYARENLQLHNIGLIKLNEDGTPILDNFGRKISNYEQKHIFTVAKIWTGFEPPPKRGNHEDLDWSLHSYLDPLTIKRVIDKDWFPKIDLKGGYIGDSYPLCADLPEQHFLKKGATYRLLGGSSSPLWHDDPEEWEGNENIYRFSLENDSKLRQTLCNPKGNPASSSPLSSGTGVASSNDLHFTAPYCHGRNSQCDSGTSLEGRSTFEANGPNTIDQCQDGSDTTPEYSESVKRIIVASTNGEDLRGGEKVRIQATITSYNLYDRVDFYFTSDATLEFPKWIFLTTVTPTVGESNITQPLNSNPFIELTLPKCPVNDAGACQQAVRVGLRSSRSFSDPTRQSRNNDGFHKPDTNCAKDIYDDTDDIVFDVLPSFRPQDQCVFETVVALDANIPCHGRECKISTIRVVEAFPGVFYEYLRLPCVNFPFFHDSVKVFAGYGYFVAMCADKRLPSASSTCCGSYSDRDVGPGHWADILCEYRGERLTYEGNANRCADWGRTNCDPQRIGSYSGRRGQCLHHQCCEDDNAQTQYLENNQYHWTTSVCNIQVKISSDGLIAVVHDPEKTYTSLDGSNPQVQSHVNAEKTVSYFHVQWDETNVLVGHLEYPSIAENSCDGGSIDGEYCLCNTTLEETAVFTSLPTREEVLAKLHVGAFDPSIYENEVYTVVAETNDSNSVSVYSKGSVHYSSETIFRIKDEYSNAFAFYRNIRSIVKVCDGAFSFRTPPTFYDIVNPELISAYQELDAYMDHVFNHDNSPPFTCKALLKHFGFSNPSPSQVFVCSQAFKTGIFVWTYPDNSGEVLSYGSGRRGCLRAIAASILLSQESVSSTVDLDPSSGGIKEPLLKLTHLMRGLGFKRSLHHRRTDGMFPGTVGQSPYGIPDQFSFFSPDYSPGGAHKDSGLVSPEAELLSTNQIVSSQNAYYMFVQLGLSACFGGIGPRWDRGVFQSCGSWNDRSYRNAVAHLDYSPSAPDLSDSAEVINELNTILTASRLSVANKALIESAYTSSYNDGGPEEALQVAQVLMLTSPEYHTTNNVLPDHSQIRVPTPQPEKNETVPYKAIIHLNLFGGMDSMSMLAPAPICGALFEEYKAARGELLYLSSDEIVTIDASGSDQPCDTFAVNKHLADLADIYSDGDAIFFSNIGHLNSPVTKKNFNEETTTQLFSHYTMREESFKVDAFGQRDGTGILGRMGDILGDYLKMGLIAIDRNSLNLIGDHKFNRKIDVISRRGFDAFYSRNILGASSSGASSTVKQFMIQLNSMTKDTSGIGANLWSQTFVDALNDSQTYGSMLATVPSVAIPTSSMLGEQLAMVTKLIKLRDDRQVNRDVFALTIGGFDQHNSLKDGLKPSFVDINSKLKALRDELIAEGVWNDVTLVMTSEFGRSVTPNASGGTDHGWGGNYFMMGGQVNGGRILGSHPDTYDSRNLYYAGRGVWIPTTPNEAMWHGIAQWFGITTDTGLNYLLPNMDNFGCRLFSESDLYVGGVHTVKGCGGDTGAFSQTFYVNEPRLLTGEEQKAFCAKVTEALRDVATLRCVILSQTLSGTNFLDFLYSIVIEYEISSDSVGIESAVNTTVESENFQADAVEALLLNATMILPSEKPSSIPSSVPSSKPSFRPSFFPSLGPSLHSSSDPSAKPTSGPSFSLYPSLTPSNKPSFRPSASRAPSFLPTLSKTPSTNPSFSPSSLRTYVPSESSRPSFRPTAVPSFSPSILPSESRGPSSKPSSSSSPSLYPSSNPSILPSFLPSKSSNPSVEPSEVLTSIPSTSPSISNSPSQLPSSSKHPSENPSNIASAEPSTSPSATRSDLPSQFHSMAPSSSAYPSLSSNPAQKPPSIATVSTDQPSLMKSSTPSVELPTLIKSLSSDTLYLPDFEGQREKCIPIPAIEYHSIPDYIIRNPSYWLFSSLENCCSSLYKWSYHTCMISLGDKIQASITTKWYPKFGEVGEELCVQSCSDGVTCGGLVLPDQMSLFDNAVECCRKGLPWMREMVCEALSNGQTPIGTRMWFVDWEKERCVQDCVEDECGGMANAWDYMYDDIKKCCDRLYWIDFNDCAR